MQCYDKNLNDEDSIEEIISSRKHDENEEESEEEIANRLFPKTEDLLKSFLEEEKISTHQGQFELAKKANKLFQNIKKIYI